MPKSFSIFASSSLNTKHVMLPVKKKIITSYSRLSEELVELFLETYPTGYGHAILPIQKPNGETIYTVRLETEECSYLVKVDVKIDEYSDEDDDTSDSGDDYVAAGGDSAREQYHQDQDPRDEDEDF